MLKRFYHYFSSSIRNQLILGITLVHAIMMSIFIFDLVERQRGFLSSQGQTQAKALAKTLAINSTSWVLARDIIGITEVLQSNSSYPDIEYAMILTPFGEVLGHTDDTLRGKYPTDQISRQLLKSKPVPRVLVADQLIIDVAYPIQIDEELVGWARVGINQEAVASGLHKITRDGLLYTLLAIVVGILFAYMMARGLTAGLKRLVDVVEETRSGNDDIRASLERGDEIGILANGMDRMLETQQQSKIALRESEDHYRTLIENIPGITYRCLNDNDFTMEYISNEIEEITGHKSASFTEKKISYASIIHPDDLQYVNDVVVDAVTKKKPFSLEYRIISSGGKTVYVFERGQLTKKGMLEGVILDITEQKTASEALRQQQQEKDLILDTMIDAVISIDTSGKIMSVNSAACSMFGYAENEFPGMNVERLMPDSISGQHATYIEEYVATGRSSVIGIGREITGIRHDGSQFPMRISVAHLPTRKGENERFIGVCHDITVEKEQEIQIRRSQKMDALGTLTGGISHDYKNMLGVINGFSELLEEGLTEQPRLKGFVHQIQEASDRALKLTNQLLTFARQNPAESKQININTALSNERDMLEKTLTVCYELVFDLQHDVWPICVEINDLENAVLNMSINAVHAMGESGKLTIATNNEQLDRLSASILGLNPGNYVMLSITDTGKGMDEETKNHIFEPFFTTKDMSGGTGLGLSQVYGFVQRSKGAIKVYSELGHGTRFVIYFPQYTGSDGDEISVETTLSEELGGKEVILIVDDEPALRSLAEEILSEHGYTTICAEDGLHALDILKEKQVDLILSDIIMPNMNGHELVAKVSELYPAIKTQLVSGFDNTQRSGVINDENHKTIIEKPFSSKKLLKRIRELLD